MIKLKTLDDIVRFAIGVFIWQENKYEIIYSENMQLIENTFKIINLFYLGFDINPFFYNHSLLLISTTQGSY
jgi:hypothetical protein